MQYYQTKNRVNRRTRRKRTLIAVLICIVLFFVSIMLFLSLHVNPIIIAMSEAKVKSYTVRAVNQAIQTVLGVGTIYDDLIEISHDIDGNITMIQTRSATINRLSKELTREAQVNMEQIGVDGFGIPIGTFTGMPILVGRGPDVNIRLMPIGSVYSNFISQFVTAGINQTNHRIYLNIETKVSLILPVVHKTISSVANIMICESIIIGKVPDTYLNSNNLDEMLNLVPV